MHQFRVLALLFGNALGDGGRAGKGSWMMSGSAQPSCGKPVADLHRHGVELLFTPVPAWPDSVRWSRSAGIFLKNSSVLRPIFYAVRDRGTW